jgi:AraC-like DNA-binding protein
LKLLSEIPEFEELSHDCGYSQQVIAWRLGVSARTIQRYSDAHFGKPLSEHLRAIRMAKALAMVEAKQMALRTIAVNLGFKQYTHFCREFKIAHGLSPTHWMSKTEEIIPPFCQSRRAEIRQRLRSLKRDSREQTPGVRALS